MSSHRELCNCCPPDGSPCALSLCQMRNDGGHYPRPLHSVTPSPAPAASYSIPGRAQGSSPHLSQCNIISGRGYFLSGEMMIV